jgi:hypothetical protein
MLYIIHATNNQAKTADTGRGAKKEPDCNSDQGRGNGSLAGDRGQRESARELFRAGRHPFGDREAIETLTRMERDRKLFEQQPAPNQAFLERGTHGY